MPNLVSIMTTYKRVLGGFFGVRDFPYLKAGIRDCFGIMGLKNPVGDIDIAHIDTQNCVVFFLFFKNKIKTWNIPGGVTL